LSDSGDQPFLEVAFAGQAVCLVTGNHAHYPPNLRQGVKVLSPSEFLNFYRRQQKGKNT
jgi:predicted nucleic acid-binding protein